MRLRIWAGAVVLAALGGCAAQRLHRSGMDMMGAGRLEGVSTLARAVQADPRDVAIRKDYYAAQQRAAAELLDAARQQQAQGNPGAAQATLARLLAIEPDNVAARQALQRLQNGAVQQQALAAARSALAAGETARALAQVDMVLAQDAGQADAAALKREIEAPQFQEHFQELSLKDANSKPINMDFRDVSVRMVLEALSRASGVAFLLDRDVGQDVRTTVVLQNADIDEVLSLILRNCQLRSKVLNKKTVQIYPDTPDKRKDYQELVVRAFYLQDASAVQIQSVLKALLRMKDVVIDERLNLVTVRDTPDAVRLAERLVALHDLAEPEVMLELEVLEVQRDDLLKLGVQWPNQVGVTPLTQGGAALTIDTVKALSSSKLGLAFTNPSVSLRQDAALSNLLANPRIRVHNREKANILIGDKVPVITTTSNANFVAESIQYLDVGLKLAVEPLIHPSNEVSLRLSLEVSSIAGQSSTPNGSVAYQVGTRNASTFLRLRDGETQVLAGLISDQDRHSASGVPGLSKLPLLGRLFSAPSDSHSKTEIVLSVTPRVVRSTARPAAQAVQFWSGTENGLSTKPLRLSEGPAAVAVAVAVAASPAPPPAAAPAPPDFIWSGPNQVKAGEQFTLSLRLKAAAGALPAQAQVQYDGAAFEVLQASAGAPGEPGEGAALASVSHDGAAQRVELNLAQALQGRAAVDATLLTLTLRARGPGGASALRIGVPSAPAGQPVAPYAVNVLP